MSYSKWYTIGYYLFNSISHELTLNFLCRAAFPHL
jgi:hypothetical protein